MDNRRLQPTLIDLQENHSATLVHLTYQDVFLTLTYVVFPNQKKKSFWLNRAHITISQAKERSVYMGKCLIHIAEISATVPRNVELSAVRAS